MRKLVTVCKRYKTFSSFKAYGKRGRHIAFRKRRETYPLLKVRESVCLESAGKSVVFGKSGEKCGLWKAREKVWSLESAGKVWCSESAGRHGVFRKREETYAAGNLDEIEPKPWFYAISRPQALSLRGLIE